MQNANDHINLTGGLAQRQSADPRPIPLHDRMTGGDVRAEFDHLEVLAEQAEASRQQLQVDHAEAAHRWRVVAIVADIGKQAGWSFAQMAAALRMIDRYVRAGEIPSTRVPRSQEGRAEGYVEL